VARLCKKKGKMFCFENHTVLSKPGRSGYLIFSGRVIQNSGNENSYLIFAPKKHYPQIRVPDNSGSGSGSGITRYTQIYGKQQTTLNFISDLYIISAAICIEFQQQFAENNILKSLIQIERIIL
jgi:hypothetical protein